MRRFVDSTLLDSNDNQSRDIVPDHDDTTYSKESQVAALYRKLVYYPFIKKIRSDKYNYDGTDDEEIPDYLGVVSWMDGCNSQLQIITKEENMVNEKKHKITCCKHSAARTALEQAADTGPMFKETKRITNNTEDQHQCNNSVYHHIQRSLSPLEVSKSDLSTTTSTRI